ncbi:MULTISPECIES: hypothetical protein [unclassified Mesorhizobium]|uniref:hypothetical protein n=1 Tax=unclassified Mesorhizobium TaxID=325217 RepID=UPI000420E547|nr:hypothetical protein [Mesorhizobium sp. LSHC420B00]
MQFDNDRAPFGRHFALSIWNDAPASWRDASGLVDRLSFEPSIIDLKPKSAGPSRTARAVSRFAAAIRARISGPGGYYNLGNALGLAMGVAMQLATGPEWGAGTLFDYFAGSGSAVALTLATSIFFCSGEVYHRAWAGRDVPDPALNRRADLLSGLGAIGLGVALFLLGQPVLAATAGLLHALGKFGSAVSGMIVPGWPARWPDPFRSAVLASRLPAALAAALSAGSAVPEVWSGASPALVTAPLTLLACYALWARADLLLFADAGESPPTRSAAAGQGD